VNEQSKGQSEQVRLRIPKKRKKEPYQSSQHAVNCSQELRSAKQGLASETIADVFSIIPSSRSTQSKDKETLYPSVPSPFTTPTSAATSWFALLVHPTSGVRSRLLLFLHFSKPAPAEARV
jgi:hypothetical protein